MLETITLNLQLYNTWIKVAELGISYGHPLTLFPYPVLELKQSMKHKENKPLVIQIKHEITQCRTCVSTKEHNSAEGFPCTDLAALCITLTAFGE